jgi:hypothetical protein
MVIAFRTYPLVLRELQLMDHRPAGRAFLPQAAGDVLLLFPEPRVVRTAEKFGDVVVVR